MKLSLYEKKENKVQNRELFEIDLSDLERISKFKHSIEFFNIPSTKIANKSIIDWFTIDNISYWWFISPMIHAKYKEAILFVDRLEKFLHKNNPDELRLHGCYDKIPLIEQLCNKNNIKLKIISKKNYKFSFMNIVKNTTKKLLYKKITKEKIKKRSKYFSNNLFELANEGSIIFTSPGIYRRKMLNKDGVNENQEFFLQPILDSLVSNNKKFLCFDLDYTFRGETKILEDRMSTNMSWVPIEVFLSDNPSDEIKYKIETLKQRVLDLQKNDLSNVFIYREISLWNFLKSSFQEIFLEPNLPTYINLIERLYNFFQKIKPALIIQIYEAGPYAKAFQIAAEKLKIKTIGVQHGLIPTDYPDYMSKEIKNEHFVNGNPLPNFTFVFGEYYKKLLTKNGNYPKEKVIVTGNPSLYHLTDIKNKLDKIKIKRRLGVSSQKIILVPLSFRFVHHEYNPDKLLLQDLYNNFANDQETIILVRSHPGDLLDTELLQKNFPCSNFILSPNTLFEDLFIADVVTVLPTSTVGTEAALFEKPVFFVNVIDNDMTDFNEIYQKIVNHDVAQFSSLEQLKQKINSTPKGELWKTNDSTKRQEFVRLFFNYGIETDIMKIIHDCQR